MFVKIKMVNTRRTDDQCQSRVDSAPDCLHLSRREGNAILFRSVKRVGAAIHPDHRLDGERRLLRVASFVEGDTEGGNKFGLVVVAHLDFHVVTREAVTQVIERQERVVEVYGLDLLIE